MERDSDYKGVGFAGFTYILLKKDILIKIK